MENSVVLQRLMEAEKDALEIVEVARRERKAMMTNAMARVSERPHLFPFSVRWLCVRSCFCVLFSTYVRKLFLF